MIGVQFEGNLLAADITTELLTGNIKGQTSADFGLSKTDKLEDEIAIAWGDVKAYWVAFQRQLERLNPEDTATSVTREMWAVPLLRSLGYIPVYTPKAEVVEGQTYAISHRAVLPSDSSITNYPPIHIIGCRLDIDKRPPSGTPRLSAHALVQEYLNKTEHLWAITTNGFRWRLLRDSSLMTRLTYIEFDLEQILNGENFAEFGLFYRLFHRSRLPQTADDADKCLLEYYHQESWQQGGRVRDRLRDGVEQALKQLGNGFLQHRDSENLRQKLSNNYELRSRSVSEGNITNYELYRQLLRLIYRLLFLMVAESRNLLLIGEDTEKARIYLEYYSIERLRELAERPRYRREGFQDIWQGLRVTFKLFDENWRGQILGLSPLNGDLFGSQTLTDLDDCGIDNYDLLTAIRYLSLYEDKGQLRRVNYAALDVEELGSVYESLLDFHPQVNNNQGIYEFNLVFGSDRKTTGSYYTPPQLVQQLIKTALEPVIEEKLRESNNRELGVGSRESNNRELGVGSRESGNNRELGVGSRESNNRELGVGSRESGNNRELGVGSRESGNNRELGVGSRESGNNKESEITNYELRITNYEQALLSIKVIDPACGSGHFLLAAARRIGKELAKIRTGEAQPAPEPLRIAIRDVIQNCIYGVDLNPLAVDLCKVALWIEGFSTGKPLNFLDHRIKCGNSLVGVLDLDCLDGGIPDDAFKPVTGDDKKLSINLKKRNKKERENQGQLSIFETSANDNYIFAKLWQELADFSENTPQEVKEKERKYQENLLDNHWWLKKAACNLWTAAFFMYLTEHNLQLLPTTATLDRLKRETVQKILNSQSNYELRITNYELQQLIDAANNLAKQYNFFHWPLEFPEVFNPQPENSNNYELGFDCVLGNPPWEMLQIAEKEFFASRSLEIANAQNKAAREKLIKELPKKNPALAQAFEDAKHDAEAQNKFIRESGRFPLTAVGKINTYSVFAETMRSLISDIGRVGVIVPTGIATDDTTKKFFGDLVESGNLKSITGFKNERFIFTGIEHVVTFCIVVIGGSKLQFNQMKFSWLAYTFADANDVTRQIILKPSDFSLLNPNTFTCPIFRTAADAELTKKIYQNVPVLENENTGINPWGISFMQGLFNMSSDSRLFHNEAGDNLVPLYEAKMFHQFDHRYSTYDNATQAQLNVGILPKPQDELKQDPYFEIKPRYWVDKKEVENKLSGKWDKNWLLCFRDICRSTDERTAIFSLLPKVGIGNNAPVILTNIKEAKLISCLLANFCSLTFDFVTRHKVGGTHMNFFIVKQLPVIPPEKYTEKDIEYIAPRVLELVYTAWDMQPFALDVWRELGVGSGESGKRIRELIIKRWEENHGRKLRSILPEFESMERSNEPSGNVLHNNENISQRRDLRNDISEPDLQLPTPDSRISGEQGGIHSISENSTGFTQGSGDTSNIIGTGSTNNQSTSNSRFESMRNSGENASFSDSFTSEQTINPDSQLPTPDSLFPPFIWNPNKRALIRAELDAYYAKLYGLTRDELRYILDPAEVYGAEFPSETFRVLKNNEIKQYGEYRTQRLVLEAWDRVIRNS